jgi:hypothetical protein
MAETWTIIDAYKWGDEDKCCKIYIELDGIGEHPKEAIETAHGDSSIEFRVRAFKGKNLHFVLRDLHENLDAKATTMTRSARRITLTIPKKADKQTKVWDLIKRPPTKWSADD